MEKIIKGKAWKFGHDIGGDADVLPFRYFLEQIGGVPIEKFAFHAMEGLNPEFGKEVKKGDFVVAGRNFGCGKCHLGVQALKALGVGAVIADSVAKGFLRGSINDALPILISEGVSEKIKQDDKLEVNMQTGEIKNLSTKETFRAEHGIPEGHPLYPIVEAGGRVEYIKKMVAQLKKA